jgi:hypothetical protein
MMHHRQICIIFTSCERGADVTQITRFQPPSHVVNQAGKIVVEKPCKLELIFIQYIAHIYIPATLVEAADYASFTYVVNDPAEGSFTTGGVCSLGNGQETCVGVEEDTEGAVTATITNSAVSLGLEIAAATGAPAPGNSDSGWDSGASQTSAGASNTGSGSAPTSSHTGAATRLSVALPAVGAFVGALLSF